MRRANSADAGCAIAQALGVVGDWWTLLVIRDVAGGRHRFDALAAELGVSRKVLAERLRSLVDNGVLVRRRYHDHPPRYEYHLTEAGLGLLPVLVALQDWGSRYVLGDGTLSATAAPDTAEARRVHALAGTRLPPLRLAGAGGVPRDPVAGTAWTVLYCFPGAYAAAAGAAGAYPPGWDAIPGARGCTLEAVTFRDRLAEFTGRDAAVVGVSTQRPDQLDAFAHEAGITFRLLSDVGLELVAALRLPTFRAGGADRLKRLTLLIDRDRAVRRVLYPVPDPVGSVAEALALVDTERAGSAA